MMDEILGEDELLGEYLLKFRESTDKDKTINLHTLITYVFFNSSLSFKPLGNRLKHVFFNCYRFCSTSALQVIINNLGLNDGQLFQEGLLILKVYQTNYGPNGSSYLVVLWG